MRARDRWDYYPTPRPARWAVLGVAVVLGAPVAGLLALWGALLGWRWLTAASLVIWLALVSVLVWHRRSSRASAWRGEWVRGG